MKLSHGHSAGGKRSYWHTLWHTIKQRCSNPNNKAFKNYGGRGISIAEHWGADFSVFLDELQTEIGDKPSPRYTLDRIDNDGDYEPGNLRWATWKEQQANKRPAQPRGKRGPYGPRKSKLAEAA